MLKLMPTLVMGAPKADLRLPEGQKGASQKPPDTDLVGLICVIFSALSSWDWKTIGDALCEDVEWNYAASGVNAGEVRAAVRLGRCHGAYGVVYALLYAVDYAAMACML